MALAGSNNSLSGSWKGYFLPCQRNIKFASSLLHEARSVHRAGSWTHKHRSRQTPFGADLSTSLPAQCQVEATRKTPCLPRGSAGLLTCVRLLEGGHPAGAPEHHDVSWMLLLPFGCHTCHSSPIFWATMGRRVAAILCLL